LTPLDGERLYAEFAPTGVSFHQTLETQPWGAKDFIVRDPDGNLPHFAGPAKGGVERNSVAYCAITMRRLGSPHLNSL
jgi:hypothetical protein